MVKALTALTPLVLLLFFFIEMPVAFALGIACLYYLVLITMPRSFAAGLDSFTLMALPFFILAGELMNAGGVTALIIRFALALVGHIRGGLGHASVVTNMIMARCRRRSWTCCSRCPTRRGWRC